MNKAFSILTLTAALCIGVFTTADAQDYRNKFLNGKALFNEGRYGLAMEAFRPVTSNAPDNIYNEYASFYFALSAYHGGKMDVAESMLRQIRQKYPTWGKSDEVRYWLALINFEQGDYLEAIRQAEEVKARGLQADVRNMKLYHLRRLQGTDKLRELLSVHSYDAEVALVLAEKISARPVMDQDKAMLDFLIAEFDLKKEDFVVSREIKMVKKPYYHVAAALPFLLDDVENSPDRIRNQFVYDLYAGMEIAVNDLRDEGIDIRLHAYDTRRDSATAAQILQRPEMEAMDLFIGPLFPQPFKVMSEFSYRNRINMMNPLSTNSDIIRDNPFSFLFLPSQETQGRKAAKFAESNFENKRLLVFYEDNERDSLKAATYATELKAKGFTVVRFIRVPRGDERATFGTISEYAEDGRIGHIFIAGSSTLTAASAITAMESMKKPIPAIVPGEWLDLSFTNFEQTENLGFYFIDPDYTSYSSEVTEAFKEKYISKTRSLPSRFAYLGYESMMVAGHMLHKYGKYFQAGFEENMLEEGRLMSGLSYKDHNDNQVVPIIRFEEAELKIVNN